MNIEFVIKIGTFLFNLIKNRNNIKLKLKIKLD